MILYQELPVFVDKLDLFLLSLANELFISTLSSQELLGKPMRFAL